MIPIDLLGLASDSRMSRACSIGTPKLPVIVSNGMAAQNSTLSSARPAGSMQSISVWTVFSIQFWIHQLALAGRERRLDERPVAPVFGAAHGKHAVGGAHATTFQIDRFG